MTFSLWGALITATFSSVHVSGSARAKRLEFYGQSPACQETRHALSPPRRRVPILHRGLFGAAGGDLHL
jgi:hypothetical protein